ncbi:gliding motility-associated C-terminal domain-containing protein [Chitinophagaceae bacterium 26-R-25]|nr:gliding motility-associated C-terminal domain-containing protein [Chitinophagaceae bacterium 26-R-25]
MTCLKRAILFLLSYLLFSFSGISQSLVNTGGNSMQTAAVSIEYSIGEISITTLSSTQNFATQGLLQPIIIHFKDCNLFQFIPNAFTPNNDNRNDFFGVKNWPEATEFELSVYNRAGQLVFKTSNILECWDGNYHGMQQPAGTYVYIISAITAQCGRVTNKGTVILIR